MKDEFLSEIGKQISKCQKRHNIYKASHLLLTITVGASGFMTAASNSRTFEDTFVSSPSSLLIFGLLSVVCALILQGLNPLERIHYHDRSKTALRAIEGALKISTIDVPTAQRLRSEASIQPTEVILKLIKNEKDA